jgi:hypothetical protein
MKSFRTIFARDLDSVSLKSEMETYGYVFIRDLMPKGDLEQLLSDMIGIASDEGWTIEGSAPSDRIANPAMACSDPEPRYKQAAIRVFNLERLHALTHHPVLTDVMKRLVGPRLLVRPKPIARMIFPNRAKGGRTWEATYADWKHDDLKYYWRDLPLRLKPSVAELAAQAEKADSPEKRLRYTTLLELIEQEIPKAVH